VEKEHKSWIIGGLEEDLRKQFSDQIEEGMEEGIIVRKG